MKQILAIQAQIDELCGTPPSYGAEYPSHSPPASDPYDSHPGDFLPISDHS